MGSPRDRSVRSLSGMNVTVRVNEPRVGAYLSTESQVFARYALDSQIRQLELAKPTLTVRAVEVGSGEPALFLHGFGLCAAHWATAACPAALAAQRRHRHAGPRRHRRDRLPWREPA